VNLEPAGIQNSTAGHAIRFITRAEAQGLREYFALRGDTPSGYALGRICSRPEPDILENWLTRAFAGEKSAAIFPEPTP
jgi:hypothetical protein